jgi:hypothetical protein
VFRLFDGSSAWGALRLAQRRQVVGGKQAAAATQFSRVGLP